MMKILAIQSLLLITGWANVAHSLGAQEPLVAAVPKSSSSSSSSSTSDLLALHKGLVERESITGNEYGVGKYLISYLKSKNFTVETQDVGPLTISAPPRKNIFAYIGKQRKTRTLVSSH